jgi:hypothetical protein
MVIYRGRCAEDAVVYKLLHFAQSLEGGRGGRKHG